MRMKTKMGVTMKMNQDNEYCWVILGQRRGRLWQGRRTGQMEGMPHSVEFDAHSVLEREEKRGDVIGFLHTHPTGLARPSERDLKTMRAWVEAFGKPMLCLIEGTDGLAGYRFDSAQSFGRPLETVEKFPRGVLIGVEEYGE